MLSSKRNFIIPTYTMLAAAIVVMNNLVSVAVSCAWPHDTFLTFCPPPHRSVIRGRRG
jgi:hypothetical protein